MIAEADALAGRRLVKSAEAFRTISEVAGELDIPPHVLRFWESRFPQVRPLKRGGGRRYYRPEDVDLLRAIRGLLYNEGYTIRGVQKLLKENRVRSAVQLAQRVRAAADEEAAIELQRALPAAAHAERRDERQGALPLLPPVATQGGQARLDPATIAELDGLATELERTRDLLRDALGALAQLRRPE